MSDSPSLPSVKAWTGSREMWGFFRDVADALKTITRNVADLAAITGRVDDLEGQPASPVSSVFNRTGAILAQAADYQAHYEPKDATLTAFAGLTIAANSLTVGTGVDTFSQTSFAANTFPARASTGDLVAKPITDDALALLADADVPRLSTVNTWALAQTFTVAPVFPLFPQAVNDAAAALAGVVVGGLYCTGSAVSQRQV